MLNVGYFFLHCICFVIDFAFWNFYLFYSDGFYLCKLNVWTSDNPAFLLCFSAKDDIDIDALAAEIEGAGAAKDQEPQKSKGKKKKEKKKQDFE